MFANLTTFENHLSEVIIAALAFLGVFISQWVIFCVSIRKYRHTDKQVAEINDAVNHRHNKVNPDGTMPNKLFDLVWESHNDCKELIEWKRGYDNGPLDNGHKVVTFVAQVDKLQQCIDGIGKRLDENKCKGFEPDQ